MMCVCYLLIFRVSQAITYFKYLSAVCNNDQLLSADYVRDLGLVALLNQTPSFYP